MFKRNPFTVLIISCWTLLVICFIAKLCGANWFEPATDNKTFILICNYMDNHNWLKFITAAIVATILHGLSILAILGQRFYTKLQLVIFLPIIIGMSLLSWYNNILSSILNFACYLLTIIWLKKRWYRAPIGIALILSFQALSLLIKNISGMNLNDQSVLIAIILQIDTFIMVFLYYLYSNYIELNRKEVKQWEHGSVGSSVNRMKS